jgi:hypothetical protein
MQGWRFDDLTRSLGKATSRRQVLKGLIGGLGAAIIGRSATSPAAAGAFPTGGCSPQSCRERALQDQIDCNTACHALACKRGVGPDGLSNLCLSCVTTCLANFEIAAHECRERGCSGGEQCCSGQCTDVRFDANNCGACGHACPPGATCDGGECSCSDDLTSCSGQCVDTQADKNNCGSCGHACDTCEACVTGQCVSIDCGPGNTCCQDNCMPLCLGGAQPDPTTCQCNNCQGQLDSVPCDQNNPNLHCCHEQCVDTTCPQGKTYDYDSCMCQCPQVDCPNGLPPDPDNCQCIDFCADKDCGDCATCDPTSGACIPVDDQTACGNGQVCCSGTCQDSCNSCDGLPCSNGDCCPNSTDWACCENGCCPQVSVGIHPKGAYCLAPGSQELAAYGITAGNCCHPSDLLKLSAIDPTTNQCDCSGTGGFGVICAGNVPSDPYCTCGPWFS